MGNTGTPVLVAGPGGRVDVYTRGTDGNLTATGQSFTPFQGYTGEVRTVVADFTGDNVFDYAFATGPSVTARVRIIDGATGGSVAGPTRVLDGFAGGAFLAAGDVNRDGRAELVVSADGGGRPLVEMYRIDGGNLVKTVSFLPYSPNNLRGVRVAMGDVNRDGAADLIVGTGPGGPPRINVYNGAALAAGRATPLGPSFLAFAKGMTSGVTVASGDVNGDGYDDLIVGKGVGGTSLVRVWSGSLITANLRTPVSSLRVEQEFFANGTASRDGITVVARDLDGDGRDELVTSAAGSAGWVRVVSLAAGRVDALAAIHPFGGQAVVAGVHASGNGEGFVLPGGPCLCCRPGASAPVCSRVTG